VRRRLGRLTPLSLVWLAPLAFVAMVALDAVAVWTTAPFDDAWIARHCPTEVLVVMGAAQYDGRPSDAFARRLDGALRLYEAGCAELVVVSGGGRPGDRTSEGAAGVAYLRAHGVPDDALLAEEEAASSFQNLLHVASLAPAQRYVIVTDDLHAHRSSVIAGRLGLSAVVAPVRVAGGRVDYAWRELQALLAYRLGVFR
jgi:uncharacterized SAM-binding protein YcdF (DUF218 family)